MTTTIVMNLCFEGVHSWPNCPPGSYASYLVHPHRHLFTVQAKKQVTHDDRQIEFIELNAEIKAHCEKNFSGPHHMSCEMMAKELVAAYALSSCTVSEDGENGAEVVV